MIGTRTDGNRRASFSAGAFVVCDFATVDTSLLRRYYFLFFDGLSQQRASRQR